MAIKVRELLILIIFSCFFASAATSAHSSAPLEQPNEVKSSCNQQDAQAIEQEINNYVHKNTAISTQIAVLSLQCASSYASAKVHPLRQSTDDAIIYLHKEQGQWNVLVLGTSFDEHTLKNIPKELIQ